MKKLIRITALCASVSVLCYACKKSDNSSSASYSATDAVFSTLAVTPKTVMLNADSDTTFYGTSGTRYIFHAGSLQTAGGTTVTGQVQLEVAEYIQKGDMIFSRLLPISAGTALSSGGEINVTATQGGQRLYLRPGYTFTANLPQGGTAPTGMQLFDGQIDSNSAQNIVNWVKHNNDSTHVAVVVVGTDTISIISDSLTLCNADQFLPSPTYQTFTVNVTTSGASIPSGTKVYGYTLYDDYKGIWPLGYFTGGYTSGAFSETHVPSIPVHFAVFTVISGVFYGGTLAATPVTAGTYSINLTAVDATTFKSALNAL